MLPARRVTGAEESGIRSSIVGAVLFLTLGLDTFAVAIGLGLSGASRGVRLRLGATFALAEGIMPIAGFIAGHRLATTAGDTASYLASIVLIAAGGYALLEVARGEEMQFDAVTPWRMLALALSVSLDELAIGFSLGLFGVSILLAAGYIAVQSALLTYAGTALGRRVGERFAEHAELLSGLVLTALGAILLVGKLTGRYG